MLFSRVHLNGLNGIRAIAALAVVISHIRLQMDWFGGVSLSTYLLAHHGVTMFFSLSGFLITYLLLLEKERGEINIKNFYVRRIFRIWPLYYLYLILAIVTVYLYLPEEFPGPIIFYILMGANLPYIMGNAIPLLIHYWSLGVEEQFYLFWPWLVKKSINIKKSLFIFLLIFIATKILVRLFLYDDAPWVYKALHLTRFDCMAIGAFCAVLFYEKNKLFLKCSQHKLTQLFSWSVIGLIAVNFYSIPFFAHNITALVTGFIIISQITDKNKIVNLNQLWIDKLGKISYGIYIIHPLVIFYLAAIISQLELSDFLRQIIAFTSVIGTTIILSYLSYYYFETPFLRKKERFSVIKTKA